MNSVIALAGVAVSVANDNHPAAHPGLAKLRFRNDGVSHWPIGSRKSSEPYHHGSKKELEVDVDDESRHGGMVPNCCPGLTAG